MKQLANWGWGGGKSQGDEGKGKKLTGIGVSPQYEILFFKEFQTTFSSKVPLENDMLFPACGP